MEGFKIAIGWLVGLLVIGGIVQMVRDGLHEAGREERQSYYEMGRDEGREEGRAEGRAEAIEEMEEERPRLTSQDLDDYHKEMREAREELSRASTRPQLDWCLKRIAEIESRWARLRRMAGD
jgi:hypothetical protein